MLFSLAHASLGRTGAGLEVKMSGKPGRSGRKPFEATADQRNTVKIMSGLGVPQEKICLLVINRQTRKPISEPTLRRAFRREIDSGQTELTTLVGNMLVEAALADPRPSGSRSKATRRDSTRRFFYLECQAGWRRGQLVENVAKEGGPSQHQVDVKLRLKDHLRRIRERLSAEQSALPPEEADKVIPGYTPEAHAELRSD